MYSDRDTFIIKYLHMKNTLHLDWIITEYFANSVGTDEVLKALNLNESHFDKVSQIMSEAQREWEAVECDEEWPNAEQDAELDRIIEETEEILKKI